jgi:recombination protein RecA
MIALGVDMEQLLISQPDFGEQALEIAHLLLKTGEIDVIVVDSVASLVPKSEVDGEIGDTKMAGVSRLMSQGLRTLNPVIDNSNCLFIFTNQIRLNPGGMGNPEEPPGGRALRHYASIRLDMRRIQNDATEELSRTKIKVLKNKIGKPFKQIEVDLVWGEGFGKEGEIVDIGIELNILQKSGSWYAYGESKIGQGRNAVIQLFKDNTELMEEVKDKIMKQLYIQE